MKLLAASVQDLFGTVDPPPGMGDFKDDPVTGLGKFLSTGIQIFFLIASLALLIYLLLGAYDWLTSGGEKEKISKAQQKIMNAVIGMLLMVAAVVVFYVIMIQVLGGKFIGPDFRIIIPRIQP